MYFLTFLFQEEIVHLLEKDNSNQTPWQQSLILTRYKLNHQIFDKKIDSLDLEYLKDSTFLPPSLYVEALKTKSFVFPDESGSHPLTPKELASIESVCEGIYSKLFQ